MKTHSKKDIFYYYRFLLYGLIPLILFGIFKNGYLLYKENVSIRQIFGIFVCMIGLILINL